MVIDAQQSVEGLKKGEAKPIRLQKFRKLLSLTKSKAGFPVKRIAKP